jgi:hypothetical protein
MRLTSSGVLGASRAAPNPATGHQQIVVSR